jgi:hypothetical protein
VEDDKCQQRCRAERRQAILGFPLAFVHKTGSTSRISGVTPLINSIAYQLHLLVCLN